MLDQISPIVKATGGAVSRLSQQVLVGHSNMLDDMMDASSESCDEDGSGAIEGLDDSGIV